MFATRWGTFPAAGTSLRFDGSQKHWQEFSWSPLLGLACVSVRKEPGGLIEGHLVTSGISGYENLLVGSVVYQT